MPPSYREYNFDGLVGPTHNYAGLSYGNVASQSNEAKTSAPRQAALQGLEKAWALSRLGFPQAVLPPHPRPDIESLRAWGFRGRDGAEVLAEAARKAPHLLAAASSASAMWTANACTMAPSSDCEDGKAHFTPANLSGNLHRSLEASFTHRLLETIFGDREQFAVHPPLPGGEAMADEGAANHTRLAAPGHPGIHLFVYGRSALAKESPRPSRFPARQTRESVKAIARLHRIPPQRSLFLQQSPEAIDAGVFHNDVIAVGNGDFLLYHEKAFLHEEAVDQAATAFHESSGAKLRSLRVPVERLPLREAVQTYLFNSQLLSLPEKGQLIICPDECRRNEAVSALLEEWIADPDIPIDEVRFFDLRESMRNGGGPACLRQRIILSGEEARSLGGRLLLDESLYRDLTAWVRRHYRESLHPDDLADPELLRESSRALDELTGILRLPALYPFQT